jgi:hypothetical protein
MIKRELNERLLYECRCDERLNSKPERSTRLSYTVSVFTVSLFFINRESESYRGNFKNECRCDESLKVKVEGSARLTYTGWCGELNI